MSTSLTTYLGLHPSVAGEQPPNHAAGFILANWVFAYCVLSSRIVKKRYGLDHNANPREDLAKYGDAAVQSGKISRRTLERIKRLEAAHANAIEGFPFFVAGVLLALQAGVPNDTVNGICLWYSLSRLGFGAAYYLIESSLLSYLRSLFWWSGNWACITAVYLAGKRL